MYIVLDLPSLSADILLNFQNTHYLEEEEKEETKSQDEEREEGKNEMVCEGI